MTAANLVWSRSFAFNSLARIGSDTGCPGHSRDVQNNSLPNRKWAVSRTTVTSLISIRVQRLCSMLCIVLALVFAGASLSGAVDQIQHAPGATVEHEHLVFSAASIERANADRLSSQPDGEEDTDEMVGGHYHHGDSGSSMLVMTPAELMTSMIGNLHAIAPERPTVGLPPSGPERPPQFVTMNA